MILKQGLMEGLLRSYFARTDSDVLCYNIPVGIIYGVAHS